jgi:type VI secretion system ImpC/EvpB family protein
LLGNRSATVKQGPASELTWIEQVRTADSHAALVRLLFGDQCPRTGREAARLIDIVVARLETALTGQVNEILHHPRLQALEASWRGLEFLRERAYAETERAKDSGDDVDVIIRVLSVSKQELWDDSQNAIDFDDLVLFKKVYEAEFGQAGGNPFSLLVGDYEFRNHPNDLNTLAAVASVAAAAFAPFVAAAAPEFFGLDDFQRLEVGLSLEQDFQQPDYIKWRALRDSDDARFVGLTLPRVLMRRPYHLDVSRQDCFRFQENVTDADGGSRHLWGNAAYAFASVVLRTFMDTRWFADIRGFERGRETGGLVAGLTVDSFSTDRDGIALKTTTDVLLDRTHERELSQLGFIPLCACPGTEYAAFFSNASVHKPAKFADKEADTTSRMSSMLQYVLCASRFAHYLKVLCRARLGSYRTTDELSAELTKWISRYVSDDPQAGPDVRAQFPLRQADISVTEIPGQPGVYRLEMLLRPHYQLDDLSASLRLIHRLPGGRT